MFPTAPPRAFRFRVFSFPVPSQAETVFLSNASKSVFHSPRPFRNHFQLSPFDWSRGQNKNWQILRLSQSVKGGRFHFHGKQTFRTGKINSGGRFTEWRVCRPDTTMHDARIALGNAFAKLVRGWRDKDIIGRRQVRGDCVPSSRKARSISTK